MKITIITLIAILSCVNIANSYGSQKFLVMGDKEKKSPLEPIKEMFNAFLDKCKVKEDKKPSRDFYNALNGSMSKSEVEKADKISAHVNKNKPSTDKENEEKSKKTVDNAADIVSEKCKDLKDACKDYHIEIKKESATRVLSAILPHAKNAEANKWKEVAYACISGATKEEIAKKISTATTA